MILMYHKVSPFSPTIWWIKVDEFYRQMWELQSKQVVYLDEYDSSNPDHVVITFDGVYKNVLTYASPILRKFNYPFELFITSEYLGLNNEFDSVEPHSDFTNLEDLKHLELCGGRIQWHTLSHPDMLNMKDVSLIIRELKIPEDLRTKFLESSFKWFAYPYGNFNEDVVAHVKEFFKGAVSCNQGNNFNEYIYNRVTVINETTFQTAKVACIIASYNYGNFLVEAIESVLRQTILPYEILITDDCSTDNTEEIALEYVKNYSTLIKYNRNEKNLGIVNNFNKAVKLTLSDYIVFLGGDNRFMSNYIEECSNILNLNSDVGIVYTDFYLFGSKAKLAYEKVNDKFKNGKVGEYYHVKFPEFNETFASFQEKENFIHGSSMYRRKCYNDVGGYLDNIHHPEDHILFSRILKKGYKAKKANNTSLEYRQHSKDQANIKFTSYSTLVYYKIKVSRLESELYSITNSYEYKVFNKYIKVKTKIKSFNRILRTRNYKYLLKRLKDHLIK